jgi:hypothetical protein
LQPTVLRAEPNRLLRWVGHLMVPGIFDGEHSLVIEPLEENRVRFVQHEAFKGVLVRPLARSLDKSTLRGFEEMNGVSKSEPRRPPTVSTSELLRTSPDELGRSGCPVRGAWLVHRVAWKDHAHRYA